MRNQVCMSLSLVLALFYTPAEAQEEREVIGYFEGTIRLIEVVWKLAHFLL